MVKYFGAVDQTFDPAIDETLRPISECSFLYDFVTAAYDPTCKEILPAVDSLWGTCLGIGVTFWSLVPLLVQGFKRFDKQNVADSYFSRDRFLKKVAT